MTHTDPELPAGYQDADLEMASLNHAGNLIAALERSGVCTHGWLNAPTGKPATCNDCGKQFENSEAAFAEGRRLINGDED